MQREKVYRAIGLMSGTSLDGVIDVALLETDGRSYVKPLRYYAHPYDASVRKAVRACFGKKERDSAVDEAEDLVTRAHIDAVKAFGESADVIGFHGQTITHDPDQGFTWQIGDGAALAKETGMAVIYDMRKNDVLNGGQGAPLLPLYHNALMSDQEKPVAILNLGGVANITYIDEKIEDLIAFDCGPANALMDDFILRREGVEYDQDGIIAARGVALTAPLNKYQNDPYFKVPPPKSLDRNHWGIKAVEYASTEDGLATLLEMTIYGVQAALRHLPKRPTKIYVAGGGRKNTYLMDSLAQRLHMPVLNIDTLGLNGCAVEAEGFAYLAVRSLLNLPLTMPKTTGVAAPLTGGIKA